MDLNCTCFQGLLYVSCSLFWIFADLSCNLFSVIFLPWLSLSGCVSSIFHLCLSLIKVSLNNFIYLYTFL